MIVDQFTDLNYQVLSSIWQSYDIPSFVKEAATAQPDDAKDIPQHCFADRNNRLFPVDSRNSTWLSAAYFSKCASEMEPARRETVARNLEWAIDYWDVPVYSEASAQAVDSILQKGAGKKTPGVPDGTGPASGGEPMSGFMRGLKKDDDEDKIKGGLADDPDTPEPDKEQLFEGIETESEHTDSPDIAEEITRDHLTEDPEYYTHLSKMEEKHQKKAQLCLEDLRRDPVPEPVAEYEIPFMLRGQKQASVAVHNVDDLQKTAEDLLKNAERYPYDMRAGVAARILDLAGEMSADISTVSRSLEKMAGRCVGDYHKAINLIFKRASMLPAAEVDDLFPPLQTLGRHIAKEGSQMQFMPAERLQKVARMIDTIDRMAGLHHHYDTIGRPEDELAAFTADELRLLEKNATLLPDGSIVNNDRLFNAGTQAFLSNYLGEQIGDYREMNEKVASLTRQDCRILNEHIEHSARNK